MRLAASHGYLPLLQELQKEFGLDAEVFRSACQGGHVEMLKWLRSEGCPWNETACQSAAAHGHLEVLKWLRSEVCPWDGRTWRFAAESTREWLEENGYPQNLRSDYSDDEYSDDDYSDDE